MDMTVGDVARRLGISTEQTRRLIDAGKLEAARTPYGSRVVSGLSVERLAVERAQRAETDRRVRPPLDRAA